MPGSLTYIYKKDLHKYLPLLLTPNTQRTPKKRFLKPFPSGTINYCINVKQTYVDVYKTVCESGTYLTWRNGYNIHKGNIRILHVDTLKTHAYQSWGQALTSLNILTCPKEDLPLYINDLNTYNKEIFMKRLNPSTGGKK